MKKNILGLTEVVEIMGEKVAARIDTGASRCSIDKTLLKRMGDVKAIKVKKVKSSHGESSRPIVRLPLKIGKRKFKATFFVSDRESLSHDVLIGRYILKKGFIIDALK